MAEPLYATAQLIRKEALLGAGANAVINTGINAWMLAGKGPHALTVDSITAHEATVFGSAVPLAVSLGIIIATMTFFTFRKKARSMGLAPKEYLARPYFFFGLRQAVASALFLFGVVVAAGVLWQRLFGTVEVSTPWAAAFGGAVAGLAAFHAAWRTSFALLRAD
jgi:hypothetical protein